MSYLSPIFLIGKIHIGNVEGASCVNIGNNLPIGFESYKKQNQGFGSITGDHNEIKDLKSKLRDSHVVDMINQSEGDDIPDLLKQIVENKFHKDFE